MQVKELQGALEVQEIRMNKNKKKNKNKPYRKKTSIKND